MDHASTVFSTPILEQNTFIHPAARSQPTTNNFIPNCLSDEVPFMNKMEEISYWISTKQAPCLYNYDNVIKRQCEAYCSKPKSVQSIMLETQSPKKKKKRKLSLLDDDSVTSKQQQNIYFETSQNKNQQTMLGCESDSTVSDLDFNIKSSSIQNKAKKTKIKKTTRATLHKKNKIVTSTPKVTGNLRRSSRKMQKRSTNSHLNNSFEAFNYGTVNGGNNMYKNVDTEKEKSPSKKPTEFAGGDQNNLKTNDILVQQTKVHNSQFDDMSDVSGFTANYIRSTKINSKKLRNVQRKGSRNFMKESQQSVKKGAKAMLMCVNKSINTSVPKTPLLNCSTDSSQNVINLITLKNNEKTRRVSRSASLLKFMDINNSSKKTLSYSRPDEKGPKSNLNISFQSKNSVISRYPKRTKNSSTEEYSAKYEKKTPQNKMSMDKRRKISKNANELNNSDRKENPEETIISRTRSGRCIGLSLRKADNSVLVLSNSMEPVTSIASINVATPTNTKEALSKTRKRNCASRKDSQRRNRSGLHRDSLRDKSGFAACFSDSDEDNDHAKEKKFFC